MAAAQAAVADGRATNISAWVNEALHRQAEHDRRMRPLDQFLFAYEAEHGAITEDEFEIALLANDGDEILTSDTRDLRLLVRATGAHVELIEV